MILAVMFGIGCLCSVPVSAQIITEMTPELIDQAIKDVQQKARRGLALSSFDVSEIYVLGGDLVKTPCYMTTPYSRVVEASRRAFIEHKALIEYKVFTAVNVTPKMIAPEAARVTLVRPRDDHGYKAAITDLAMGGSIVTEIVDPGCSGTIASLTGDVARCPCAVRIPGS